MNQHDTTSGTAARSAVFAAIVSLLVALTLIATSGPAAGAAQGCGEYSFGFAGTRLIDDGISNSAGPFPITLPAGNYEISLVSHDNHPSADYQVEQTQEQWYVELDNGFTSSLADDVPAAAENLVTTIAAQPIRAATAISVHHKSPGVGPNSVDVVCVGFTSVEVIAEAVVRSATTSSLPAAPVAPAAPVVPAAPVAPVASVSPAAQTTTTIEAQVAGKVEVTPAAQLAVTGASPAGLTIVAVGAILLGSVAVVGSRTRRRIS
jgi:hypothetical protein